MESIVDLQMNEVRERLAEHGVSIELTDGARKLLARTGYDPAFGARPLRRAIQKFVESPLSIKILQGEFAQDDVVLVVVDEKGESVVFAADRAGEGGAGSLGLTSHWLKRTTSRPRGRLVRLWVDDDGTGRI
jgi:hypothetical protein